MAFGNKFSNPLYLTHRLYIGENEIKDLEIPSSVSSIGQYAFVGASELTSVSIPNSVNAIGKDAFAENTSLKKAKFADIDRLCVIQFASYTANPLYLAKHLYFGENNESTEVKLPNIETIPQYTFANAAELTKVTIPEKVDSIGPSAFEGCTKLQVVDHTEVGRVSAIHYANPQSNPLSYAQYLTINGTLTDNVSINDEVSSNAFYACKWLKKVTIGESVTSIGNDAFRNCTALTEVSLPNSLNKIGNNAFNACYSLQAISLKGNLKTIGEQAFRDCRQLKSVTVPSSVTTLSYGAFMYCSQLETITLESELTSLSDALFQGCSKLQNITLPSTVQTIGKQTFAGCSALETIPLTENLNWIGTQAFDGCKGFTSLVLNEKGHITTIGEKAFYNCSNITSVTLPATVGTIMSEAFVGCTNLVDVFSYATNVPETSENAFGTLSGNITLHVDGEVSETNYGNNAPWNTFLKIVVMGNHRLIFVVNDDYTEVEGSDPKVFHIIKKEEGSTITEQDIKTSEGIFSGWDKVIPKTMPGEDMTFYGYTSEKKEIDGLSYHLLPAEKLNGKNLERRAHVISSLSEKYSMQNITIKEKVKDDDNDYTVDEIDRDAFAGCIEVRSVELPNSIKQIGANAFSGCSNLMSVTLPSNLESISDSLFMNCISLSVINLNEGIKSIGQSAFSGCKSLQIEKLPSELTSIGKQAFRSCESIESIELPAKIANMDEEVFFYCLKLKDVSFVEGFDYEIPNRTFQNCFSLKNIELLGSIKNIGNQAFENCQQLTTLIIPAGINIIGNSAFSGCTQLANVTIPETVTAMGSNAFAGCLNINQLTINNTTPPTVVSSTFDEKLKDENAYLYVPENADEKYGSEAPWTYFTKATSERKTLTFIIDDGQGSIEVDDGQGNITSYPKTHSEEIMVGDKISPYTIPDPDNRFSGWKELPEIMPSEDLTVYGQCKYRIRYYEDEVDDSKQLLNGRESWLWYGEKIQIPTEELKNNRENYDFEIAGLSEDGKMPARHIDAIVTYFLSEVEKTDGIIKYKIWVRKGQAEVMESPNAAGDVNIPEEVEYNNSKYTVTSIHEKAFNEKKQITSITLPQQLETIGYQAFRGCLIEDITIPGSVTQLGEETFLYCGRLKNVVFANKNTISELPAGMFRNCVSLETIDLPNLTAIGEGAFEGCINLTEVNLPASVTTIGSYAYSGCTKIEAVKVNVNSNNSLPVASESSFDESAYNNATLYVLEGVNLNNLSQPWSKFGAKESPEGTLSETCKDPIIDYKDGKLTFTCETQGVTFVSKIKSDDVGNRTGVNSLNLNRKYIVEVYAQKNGAKKSNVVTKEIYNIGDANGDGIVDAQDASLVMQHAAKKIKLFDN